MSETIGVVKALPKFTTSSSSATGTATDSETISSSTSSYSATVTPPSAARNPNIWNPHHKPDGTVFIAVGSIVGAMFLGMILWSMITSHLSRRTAKRSLREDKYRGHDRNGSGFYDNGEDKEMLGTLYSSDYGEMEEKRKKSRLNLLSGVSRLRDSSSSETLPAFDPEWLEPTAQETFNPIQDTFTRYNRNSLFISPTIEVAQKQNLLQGQRSRLEKPYNHSSVSASSLSSSDENVLTLSHPLNKPERAASPERKEKKVPVGYHKRNKSSLGLTPVSSSQASNNDANDRRPRGSHKKQTPSMYLEDILNVNSTSQG